MAALELKQLNERAAKIRGLVLDVDGVLSDGRLYYGPDGENEKSYYARDGLGLVLLRQTGMRLGILSGRNSPAVQARADELQMEPCLLGRSHKREALLEIADSWELKPSQLAAMGDDWVDLPMLEAVGLSGAPADAAPEILDRVHFVADSGGGRGAVREFCELILRASTDWPEIAARYGLQGER